MSFTLRYQMSPAVDTACLDRGRPMGPRPLERVGQWASDRIGAERPDLDWPLV